MYLLVLLIFRCLLCDCTKNRFDSFIALTSCLLLCNLDALPQTLNLELVTRASAVDIFDIVRCGFEVAGCVIAPGHKDLVGGAVIERLVQRDRRSL